MKTGGFFSVLVRRVDNRRMEFSTSWNKSLVVFNDSMSQSTYVAEVQASYSASHLGMPHPLLAVRYK